MRRLGFMRVTTCGYRRRLMLIRMACLGLLVLWNQLLTVVLAAADEETSCPVFLAPTATMDGWGVFAGQDFVRGDIVEMAPIMIPLPSEEEEETIDGKRRLKSSFHERLVPSHVPYNHHHRPYRSDGEDHNKKVDDPKSRKKIPTSFWLGYQSVYRRHRDYANLRLESFVVVDGDDKDDMIVVGMVAMTDIAAGDQLYLRHGDDAWMKDFMGEDESSTPTKDNASAKESGSGNQGEVQPPPGTHILPMDLPIYKSLHCSKLQQSSPETKAAATATQKKQKKDVLLSLSSTLNHHDNYSPYSRVVLGEVRATQMARAGDILETSVGWLTSWDHHIQGTALAPLVYTWQDWSAENRRVLRKLRRELNLPSIVIDSVVRWDGYDDLAIMLTGNLMWVRRQSIIEEPENGSPNSHDTAANKKVNCVLHIKEKRIKGSEGLTVELVALKRIRKGDLLVVSLPSAPSSQSSGRSSVKEQWLLQDELDRTGQLYYEGLFPDRPRSDEL